MKKTMKTAMTAAMFAASLGATAGNAQYASAISQSTLENALSFEETTPTYQTVYGPPEVMQSLFGTTTEEEPVQLEGEPVIQTTNDELLRTEGVATVYTDDDIELGGVAPMYTDENGVEIDPYGTTTTCTTEPEVLYGPPSVLFNHGDLNMDKKLDARDLTLLKQRYLKGYTEISWGELGDLDGDGELTKKDIKMLERMLTGKPEDEDEDDTTRYAGTTTTTTTTTTVPWDETAVPQPVYGPPPAFE